MIAIVGSLIFVGLQIRQDQNIAIAQIFADHDDTQREWAQMMIENNDVWVRGLKGEQLDENENSQFTGMAIAYLQMDVDRYRRAMLITSISPRSVIVKQANILNSYPGLHRVWEEWLTIHSQNSAATWVDEYHDAIGEEIDEIRSGSRQYIRHSSFAPM